MRFEKDRNREFVPIKLCDSACSLPIIRHNYRSVEYVRGLIERQIIGHPVEVPMVFPLLYTDSREQESFPCHLHTQGSHVPMARDNLCLSNLKVA